MKVEVDDGAVDTVAEGGLERWVPVPSCEGLYEVSTFGRVRRSSASRLAPSGYILKPQSTYDGYVKYSLFRAGRYWHITGHRLVAITFLGPPPSPNAHAAHQDGNRKNNRLSNIRWATPVENEADKKKHGTAKGARPGERHHNAKLDALLVAAMRQQAMTGMELATVARKFNVSKTTAYDAIVGRTWKAVIDPKPLECRRRQVS